MTFKVTSIYKYAEEFNRLLAAMKRNRNAYSDFLLYMNKQLNELRPADKIYRGWHIHDGWVQDLNGKCGKHIIKLDEIKITWIPEHDAAHSSFYPYNTGDLVCILVDDFKEENNKIIRARVYEVTELSYTFYLTTKLKYSHDLNAIYSNGIYINFIERQNRIKRIFTKIFKL